MAASSLSTFSSFSLHHSSRRFPLLSPLPTTSLYFPLPLSTTTKLNCTIPDITLPVTDDDEEPQLKSPFSPSEDYREPDLDPFTSTEDEIAAAYERLYGPAYSGVTLLNNNVYEMDAIKERDSYESNDRDRGRDGFDEQLVQIRRVTKVVKGGKQLKFRAIVVVGNRNGKVGVGHSKASEIASAIQKASLDARRNIIEVPLTKHMTFPHRANGKFGAAEVMLRPACPGTGVIAGGAVRVVLELAGLQNALGKQLRSNNALNNARATVYAILKMRQFSEVSADRGIPIEELWK